METSPYVKLKADAAMLRARTHFCAQAAAQGHPCADPHCLRIEKLVIVVAGPGNRAAYEVITGSSGDEDVRYLENPTEEDLARLCGD